MKLETTASEADETVNRRNLEAGSDPAELRPLADEHAETKQNGSLKRKQKERQADGNATLPQAKRVRIRGKQSEATQHLIPTPPCDPGGGSSIAGTNEKSSQDDAVGQGANAALQCPDTGRVDGKRLLGPLETASRNKLRKPG